MTETATLITQLRVVAHLTRAEAQVARLRVAQASTDDVRRELAQNAENADARSVRIVGALRDLGALPDPVTPALGRLTALVRGAVEQTQPLDEALLGDLTLEHQLRDRARYLAALARGAGLPAVEELADDLVVAHTATVDWLTGVLADVASGAPAALAASPLQRVAGQVARAVNAPARPVVDGLGHAVADGLDRAVGTVGRAGLETGAAVEEYAGKAVRATGEVAKDAASAGQEALVTGRDVAVQAVGSVVRTIAGTPDAEQTPDPEPADAPAAGADADAAADTAPVDTAPVDTALDAPAPDAPAADVPAPTADALPIAGFPELEPHAAVAALRTLDDPADVAAVLAFEQAHDNRAGVVAAARARAGAVRPAHPA